MLIAQGDLLIEITKGGSKKGERVKYSTMTSYTGIPFIFSLVLALGGQYPAKMAKNGCVFDNLSNVEAKVRFRTGPGRAQKRGVGVY